MIGVLRSPALCIFSQKMYPCNYPLCKLDSIHAMDYSAIINSIRVERLELVEILAENRLDLLETLNHLTKTSPSMTQLILPVMEQYRQLNDDISSMLDNLNNLEEKLIARVI